MQRHLDWVKAAARAGYGSRGVVYLIIGALTVLAAFGSGEGTDSEGAVRTLLSQPFGTFLVWLLIAGLAGYVMWRLIQALFDTDDHGVDPKGLAVRAALLVSAFTYTTLAIYALSLLGVFSGGTGDGGGGSSAIADFFNGLIGTRIVSLALAAIFAGVAGAHWHKALTQKYADHIRADEQTMKVVHPVSMIGLTARGTVFGVLAILLVLGNASSGGENGTPGLEDALSFVRDLPAGTVLLALMGAGLIAFSAYSFAEAIWRRINVEEAT